ncbi:MAG: FapA family protein, partial [Bacillota bacterium]
SQGELLVLRTPPIPGVPGVTVTGRSIAPRAGRNLPLPRGKNTVPNDDNTELRAAIDGHVMIVDGKVTVHTVLEISGNVDYSTGNIDYIGNVRIRGNITAGFTVKAGGDIEVNGVIEGATVIAQGNIVVKNGIAGGHKGMVQAGGSLFARFVENARVEVGGDVVVAEAIIQSVVSANNCIRVEGRKAVIVGGTLQAGEEISARVIGSALSPQTVLEVGLNPRLREEKKLIYQEYQDKKKSFENINQYLQAYQKTGISPENLTSKRKLALAQMLSDYKTLQKELEELLKRKQEIDNELNRLQGGRVKAADMVYPGVQITIGQAQYHVNDPIRYALFTLRDGDIKIEPLR